MLSVQRTRKFSSLLKGSIQFSVGMLSVKIASKKNLHILIAEFESIIFNINRSAKYEMSVFADYKLLWKNKLATILGRL